MPVEKIVEVPFEVYVSVMDPKERVLSLNLLLLLLLYNYTVSIKVSTAIIYICIYIGIT